MCATGLRKLVFFRDGVTTPKKEKIRLFCNGANLTPLHAHTTQSGFPFFKVDLFRMSTPKSTRKEKGARVVLFLFVALFRLFMKTKKSMDTYRHFQKDGRALFHDRASRQTHTNSRKKRFFLRKRRLPFFAIRGPAIQTSKEWEGQFFSASLRTKKGISMLLGSSRRNTKESSSSSSWERYRTLEIDTIRPLSRFNSINPFHAHVRGNLRIREKKRKKG